MKELSTVSGAFKTLERLAESGLLEWNQKHRQLLIDSSLALLMMKDADSWSNFMQNVFLWLYYSESQAAWEDYMQKEELAAVRKFMAGKPHSTLSRGDIDRIREARRQEIIQSDMEPPKVEGFEFFIVKPPVLNENKNENEKPSGQPVGQLVSVGHYDPETGQMEMALWRDVEPLLKAGAEKNK